MLNVRFSFKKERRILIGRAYVLKCTVHLHLFDLSAFSVSGPSSHRGIKKINI
jgi:hypothetical protein